MIRNKLIQLSLATISVVPVITAVSCSNEKEIQKKMDFISNRIRQDDFLGPENTAFDTKVSYSSWKRLSEKNITELSTEGWYWYFGTTKTIEKIVDDEVEVSFKVVVDLDWNLNDNPEQHDIVVAVVGRTTSEKNKFIVNRLRYKANRPSLENALIAANEDIDANIEHLLEIFKPTSSGGEYSLQAVKTFSDFPDNFSKEIGEMIDTYEYEKMLRSLLGRDFWDQFYRFGWWNDWSTSWEKNEENQTGTLKFAFNIEPAEIREIAITVYPRAQ